MLWMCNKPLLLEDNGMKAREKAVSTKVQPFGFQKPVVVHSVYRHTPTQASQTHIHNATVETHSVLRTDRKFNKGPCCSKSFIFAQGKNIQNNVLFMSNNVCP